MRCCKNVVWDPPPRARVSTIRPTLQSKDAEVSATQETTPFTKAADLPLHLGNLSKRDDPPISAEVTMLSHEGPRILIFEDNFKFQERHKSSSFRNHVMKKIERETWRLRYLGLTLQTPYFRNVYTRNWQ
jgi:hypothetical protein